MNKKHENKQTMWDSVDKILDENQAIVATIAGFVTSVAAFKTQKNAAEAKLQEADLAHKGKVEEKDNALKDLIPSLTAACSSLTVYANKTNDAELVKKSSISPSDWNAMRDTVLRDTAKAVIDMVDAHASDLAEHGFVSEKIVLLKSRFAAYSEALADRLSSSSQSIGARETALTLSAEVDGILKKEIDLYVEQMKEENQEFYSTYWNARHIKDLGVRHAAIAVGARHAVSRTVGVGLNPIPTDAVETESALSSQSSIEHEGLKVG